MCRCSLLINWQVRATRYLDSLLDCNEHPCTSVPYTVISRADAAEDLSYMQPRPTQQSISHAPCVGRPCLLETNVSLLPDSIIRMSATADKMLDLEAMNLRILGQ